MDGCYAAWGWWLKGRGGGRKDCVWVCEFTGGYIMKKQVLVLDDDHGVRRFLSRVLDHLGLEASESGDIQDALSKCTDKKFDLIILDYNLSNDEIGWEVARAVRKNEKLYGAPKIIGISGTVDIDIVETLGFSSEDFDAFLPKPFIMAELEKLMEELM